MSSPDPRPLAIIGLGNLLLTDDGIGCHAIESLRMDPPRGAVLIDAGTAIIRLLPELEAARAVIFVDACCGGGPPGTVYVLDAHNLAQEPTRSLHQIGLSDAIRWMSPDERDKTLLLVGIEPDRIEYGMGLSAALGSALPRALAIVRKLAVRLGQSAPLPDCTPLGSRSPQ